MTVDSPQSNTIKIVYVLYLASLVFGITGLIGLIVAYVNQAQANEVEAAHFRFQIRTFWIGLLYAVIGGITTFVGIGVLVLLVLLVWWIVRCVKGLTAINAGRAPDDVTTWMF
ncbi:MAG: hypothetical protein V2I38_15425 [Alcanivoracaceae bacterium]|jgi:uncharacterized membrane protein|nr:hypothetical protein [Alcanivoracaceae bacterium]